MDFRWPPGSAPSVPGGSPPAWFSHPQAGPLPPPLREHIIREAVTRRLNEEWAMGVHGGFRPSPFFAPDRLMPPPHAPMPMPMHPLPHAPPPVPPVPFEGFGAWQGPGPRRHAGYGERTPFPREERRASPPRPDPKRKVKLPEIEPSSRTPEVLSPKVPMVKRKADANAATTVPKKVQKLAEDWSAPSEAGLNEHLGGRKHKAKLAQCGVSKAIKDDKNCLQTTTGNENSTDPCDARKKICMLVDGATCEAGLNEHLGGGKHKAKLALCGASKAIKDDKNSLHTTIGNKNNTDPCDAPKKIFLEVDGEMHEVVRKNNYLWCDCCRVRGDSNVIMAGHLRGKKHSKLNKVWTSIKAVRINTNTKEGLPSCGNQVNTNGSTEIPGVIAGDINMTTEVDESSPVENPVQKEIHLRSKKHSKTNNVWTSIKAVRTNTGTKKGLPSCGSQLNTNGPVENPVQKEIHLRSKKHSKLNNVWTSIKAVRTNTDTKEGLPSCGSQLNTNGSSEIPAVIKGEIDMTTEVDESGPVENPVQKEIHPRSKKHSKLNQVWTSIKAVRTNTNTKEGLPSCGSQVTPRLKELIMFKAQQEAKSDPSSAPKETYANDSSQKRKPSQMTSKVQPPAKKRKDNPPKKTVSSDDHRLKEQRTDSRLQEAGEVSRGKAEAFVEMKVEGDSKGGNTSSNQPKPYLHSDKCTAYMSKINLKATELHIRGFFSDIGGVVDIRLQRDRFTKKSRGLAHVDFSDKDHLEAAIRKNKQKLFGKNVIIKDSSKRKKNRKAGTSAKANTKVWTSIKALLSKNVSIAPSDPSKSKKNREAGTSAKANTKVWTSIKAVRTNSNTKEGLPSSCGSQVNTNGSTKIPAVIEGDINMTTAVDESGPVENPVRKEITRMATIKAARTNTNTKEGLPSCGSQVNTDGSTEIPAVIEGDINMTTLVDESGPVENLVRKQIARIAAIKAVRTNTDTKEGLPSSCGSQVNTNGCTEIPAVIEGDLNMSTGVDESGPVENPVQKEITRMATIWAMFSS